MKIRLTFVLGISVFLGIVSCGGDDNYVPKPHAFPKIELPSKVYKTASITGSPYEFEIPQYARISEDSRNQGKHWYNVDFPELNATLHMTYYPFSNWADYDSMVNDTRSLVNKHLQKAEDIVEDPVELYNPNLHGVIFHIEGNTASNLNFYVTDSAKHFLRGALYFNVQTEPDSIMPVFKFLEKDVQHVLKTIRWK
jgi:gliding motility-associated lipoprotein GldD